MDRTIHPSSALKGEITVPGDKSISHRSVMFGAIADGTTEITGFLAAADPLSTLSCFNAMGITHRFEGDKLYINGKGLHGLQKPSAQLDAGNSGTTIRLICGILAGQHFPVSISGDQYLVKRPMKRIIDPLRRMGADITATEAMTAPLSIRPAGTLTAIDYELPVASAQVKSAVLLAGLYANGTTRVIESEQSRDHTERMLGLPVERSNGRTIVSVKGGQGVSAGHYAVPGDPSSAAFFVVAGLIVPGSEILIRNVGMNPSRIGFLSVLKRMGGSIEYLNERTVGGEPLADLLVRSSQLSGDIILEGEIIPNIIDEIPVLSVAAAFSAGSFHVKGAQDLRNKETDRIEAVCANLRTTGLTVESFKDGFAFVSKNSLFHGSFDSFDDHRIAMAFGVASLALNGPSTIRHAECVSISYPAFWETMQSLQR
ncbi:MAG: 3-phosphoshikimate 1-carboxyvinyltransferase [Bacteroidetes bacterium]|nr:3-phosphoshikimate 1-carboxyvinyltransferase [Bacteroidota bacterium]